MKRRKLVMILLLAFGIWSCTNDSEADLIGIDEEQIDDGGDEESSDITYENGIKSIIDSSCIGCHDDPPRNGAPFSLVTYQQVSARANSILNAMSRQSGSAAAMPPSGRLPQTTIDKIQEWIDNELREN